MNVKLWTRLARAENGKNLPPDEVEWAVGAIYAAVGRYTAGRDTLL